MTETDLKVHILYEHRQLKKIGMEKTRLSGGEPPEKIAHDAPQIHLDIFGNGAISSRRVCNIRHF